MHHVLTIKGWNFACRLAAWILPATVLSLLPIHQPAYLNTGSFGSPVFDFFHTVAANYTCNFGDIGIHLWRPDKKIFEITVPVDLLLQGLFIVSCQPKNNGVYLFLCATLAFAFYIQGI
jgi:hypothetical protein